MNVTGGLGGTGGSGGGDGGQGGRGGDVQVNVYSSSQESKLEELRRKDLGDVQCDTDAVCLPNTRRALLTGIKEWVEQTDGNCILWLHGNAGSGKSTVANTIVSYFNGMGRLVASFQFNRDMEDRNTPHYLFRNIAYQLARSNNDFKGHLLEAIDKCGTGALASRKQLQKLIIEPMSKTLGSSAAVIVIDGLDECGDESMRRDVLKAIADADSKLADSIKIILTSRNEPDICAELESTTFPVNINHVEGVEEDIRMVIEDRMKDVVKRHTYLDKGWPGPVDKRRLLDRAGGLFIWVTVASEYIKRSVDPRRVLANVLDGQPGKAERALDKLYLDVLKRREIVDCTADEIKYVLGSILVAKIPLTGVGLDSLLGLSINNKQTLQDGAQIQLSTCSSLINALGPILLISGNKIRFLHASIVDFFTDRNRCTEQYFIDKSKYGQELVIRCFQTMDSLRRDICGINNPTKLNSEILDLNERVGNHVGEHLQYACVYWSQHLVDVVDRRNEVYRLAKGFLFFHLLHWIEMMSLLNDTSQVFISLNQMKTWLQKLANCEENVYQLVDDAFQLMQKFHEPIERSAAHVYVSAIPLASPNSILFKNYAPTLADIPKPIYKGGANSALSTTLWVEGCNIGDFSPDCAQFVYATRGDRKLRVLDVTTGAPLHAPLTGHDAAICKIQFSRDSKKFCSLDKANRIITWDASRYTRIGRPIQLSCEEGSQVEKVGFCEDKVVVLGGGMVHVWDIATAELAVVHNVLGEDVHLQGSHFTSATYAEELTFLVNERQSSLRIINTVTREDVTHKLTRGQEIDAAVFSLDGAKVFLYTEESHSATMTDVESGNIIIESTQSEEKPSFTANGKHAVIIRGSSISIFDINTGALTASMKTQYWTEDAQSAQMSVNGTRLLVCDGHTIEILDMQSGVTVKGRKGYYDFVFLSPDGNRVAQWSRHSGSITIYDVTSLSTTLPSIKSITPSPTNRALLLLLSDNSLRLIMDITSDPVPLPGAKSPAAFSPDGSTVVSACSDYTLQLWNSKDAKLRSRLQGHTMAITAVAFSPNGDRLISASVDGTIRLWSTTLQGRELQQLRAYSIDVRAISLSEDESKIFCVSKSGAVKTLDVCTGRAFDQLSKSNWVWADFSPDGNEIICMTSNGRSRLIDCRTGHITEQGVSGTTKDRHRQITELVFSPTKKHFVFISEVETIDFSERPTSRSDSDPQFTCSSDGKWIISVDEHKFAGYNVCMGYSVCMWDSQSRQCMWEFQQDTGDLEPCIHISSSGNKTCIWSREICHVRETDSGAIISCWSTTNFFVDSIAFSLDERQIVLSNHDEGYEFKIWDIESGTEISIESHTEILMNPPPAGDCTECIVMRKHWTLTLCDTTDHMNRVIYEGDHCLSSLALSSNGSRVGLLVGDGRICIWDTYTGCLLGLFSALKHAMKIKSFVFSPEGNRLIIHHYNGPVLMWNIHNLGEDSLGTYYEFDDDTAAAFFPNGPQLLTSLSDETRIWDTSSISPFLISTKAIHLNGTLTISSDGTRLLSESDIWAIENFQLRKVANFDGNWAKFSPDGKHIIAQPEYSDGLHVLDSHAGTLLYQTDSFSGRLGNISFSLDSKCVCAPSHYSNDLTLIKSLPTSIEANILSPIYPPEQIMWRQKPLCFDDGWYFSIKGRLMWFPEDMRSIWLARGRQGFGSRCLIVGRDMDSLTILDMEDYLQALCVKESWREGGIRYDNNQLGYEITLADALGSTSGSPGYAFSIPYIESF